MNILKNNHNKLIASARRSCSHTRLSVGWFVTLAVVSQKVQILFSPNLAQILSVSNVKVNIWEVKVNVRRRQRLQFMLSYLGQDGGLAVVFAVRVCVSSWVFMPRVHALTAYSFQPVDCIVVSFAKPQQAAIEFPARTRATCRLCCWR